MRSSGHPCMTTLAGPNFPGTILDPAFFGDLEHTDDPAAEVDPPDGAGCRGFWCQSGCCCADPILDPVVTAESPRAAGQARQVRQAGFYFGSRPDSGGSSQIFLNHTQSLSWPNFELTGRRVLCVGQNLARDLSGDARARTPNWRNLPFGGQTKSQTTLKNDAI